MKYIINGHTFQTKAKAIRYSELSGHTLYFEIEEAKT
jgi:hypothetical protein